jgi:hypothetical protein
LNRRLGVPQSRPGRYGEERNQFPIGSPARGLVRNNQLFVIVFFSKCCNQAQERRVIKVNNVLIIRGAEKIAYVGKIKILNIPFRRRRRRKYDDNKI